VWNLDRLKSVEVFVRVAELGSFAAAAKELRLSPSMVVKHVQQVEARLGAQVIRRTTRRHSLTEVGRMYLQRAKALLADFESAESLATELHGTPRGTLRITAPVVFGAHALAPVIAALSERYPGLEIELHLQDRVVDLLEEGYDAALRTGTLADSGLIARPLAPLTMLLAAAPAYLERRGTPRKPQDLERHECLGFIYLTHPERWRLVGRDETHSVRVRSRLRFNNGEALRQAALNGAGVIMQSRLLLASDLERGVLVRVLPGYAPPPRAAHIVYAPDRFRSAKPQRFVELVLEQLGPGSSSRSGSRG
jgi:DNA-binding transcriptional LysR family regulator